MDILEAVVAGKVRETVVAREVGDSVLYHSLAGLAPPTAIRHYGLVRDARHEALPVMVPFRRSPARPSAVQLHHRPSVLPLGSP